MAEPKMYQPLSSSVGDYLKAVWGLAGPGVAAPKDLSSRLSVSSASVSEMLRRLQALGLVEYERYRGASLTKEGRAEALRLVRRHRLIETFLLEHLGYPWENVHEEAERLEHAVSEKFTERLAELLGNPEQDPHGAPIPAADGSLTLEDSLPLSEAKAGRRVRVSRVSHQDSATLAYLAENGLMPGRLLKVEKVRTLDGVITVTDEDGATHSLGAPLAGALFVRSAPENG